MSGSFEFAFGLNRGMPEPPFFDKHRIMYGFPERHRERIQLDKEYYQKTLEFQRQQLRQSNAMLQQFELVRNEAFLQNQAEIEAIQDMSWEVTGQLQRMEKAFGAYFFEIKWVLGHIHGTLGEMLELLKAPLATAAHELLIDGYRALWRGYLDQAREVFEEALRHKPSDFAALTSLALIHIKQDDLGGAERLYEKAVAFAPDEVLPDAHENLARVLYVQGRVPDAYDLAKQADSLREKRGRTSVSAKYLLSLYALSSQALEHGRDLVQHVCSQEPLYFSTYLTDGNFESVRPPVLLALNELAEKALQQAQTAKDNADEPVGSLIARVRHEGCELEELQRTIETYEHANDLLILRTYSCSMRATRLFNAAEKSCRPGWRLLTLSGELANLEPQLEEAKERFDAARRNYSEAQSGYVRNKYASEQEVSKRVKTTERTVENVKAAIIWILVVLGLFLIIAGSIDMVQEGGLLGLILGVPVLIVVGGIIYLVGAAVAGWIATRIVDILGKSTIASIHAAADRVDMPFWQQAELDEAQRTLDGIDSQVRDVQRQIASTKADLADALQTDVCRNESSR